MSFLQRFYASMILAMLQASIKNPKSLAKEAGIITQIRDAADQVLAGINA